MVERHSFDSGHEAVIRPEDCDACGICHEVCRFDAVRVGDRGHVTDPLACEGCGYCVRVCPEAAIAEVDRPVGDWYVSTLRTGATMVHARLGAGADNSGKLVTQVKNEARRLAMAAGRPAVLVDGSPGVGCPVVSSLSGASFVVLVTEPTVAGLHDLRRVHELVDRFGIPCGCIVNKADLNADVLEDLRGFLGGAGIPLLAEIPYDEAFTAALTAGRTVVESGSRLAGDVGRAWRRISERVGIAHRPETGRIP